MKSILEGKEGRSPAPYIWGVLSGVLMFINVFLITGDYILALLTATPLGVTMGVAMRRKRSISEYADKNLTRQATIMLSMGLLFFLLILVLNLFKECGSLVL